MSDRTHALLNPSSADRFINCPPSVRLSEPYPDIETDFAMEGTLVHELIEAFIKDRLGIWNALQHVKALERIQSHRLYKKEMLNYAYDFKDYVLDLYSKYRSVDPSTKIFIEEEIDLSGYIPEGYGHNDIGFVTSDKIHIIDFKYGQGVRVEAENNSQLKVYALGIYDKVMLDRDIEEIEITVYQPRMDNISTDVIDIETFLSWVKLVLMPAAELAYKGEGNFKSGPHCKFCRVKAQCRAHAEYNLQLADEDFKDVYLLSDDEIRAILDKAKVFTEWIKAVEEYALSEAVKGKKWKGLKLVEGRSTRRYKNEAKIIKVLQEKGYTDDQIFDKTIKNLTELEAYLGKKYFNSIFKNHIVKPQGKPTLVPLSDKRDEFALRRSAEDDFSDLDLDDDILKLIY